MPRVSGTTGDVPEIASDGSLSDAGIQASDVLLVDGDGSQLTGLTSAQVGLGNVLNVAQEPAIAAGTTSQYWRGDKTWQSVPVPALADVVNAGDSTDGGNLSSGNGAFLLNGTTGDATFAGDRLTLNTVPIISQPSLGSFFIGGGGTVNTGSSNSAQGVYALLNNTTGSYNSAQGFNALYSNTTGLYNSAQGFQALLNNTTGYGNSAQGASALYNNTTGSYNSAQGYEAGYNPSVPLETLNNCTFVGANSNASTDGLTNSTAIGYGAQITASNQIVLGNSDVTEIITNGSVNLNGNLIYNVGGMYNVSYVNAQNFGAVPCYAAAFDVQLGFDQFTYTSFAPNVIQVRTNGGSNGNLLSLTAYGVMTIGNYRNAIGGGITLDPLGNSVFQGCTIGTTTVYAVNEGFASGEIGFISMTPNPGDTITINGTVFTYSATPYLDPTYFSIDYADPDTDPYFLTNVINNNAIGVTATTIINVSNPYILLRATAAGSAGNIPITTTISSGWVSGMSGGADSVTYPWSIDSKVGNANFNGTLTAGSQIASTIDSTVSPTGAGQWGYDPNTQHAYICLDGSTWTLVV